MIFKGKKVKVRVKISKGDTLPFTFRRLKNGKELVMLADGVFSYGGDRYLHFLFTVNQLRVPLLVLLRASLPVKLQAPVH